MIHDILDDLDLSEIKLRSFKLQIQMYRVPGIKNLIPYSLQILNLGSLDAISFESLVEKLTSEDFQKKSDLISIKIMLNLTVVNYKEIQSSVEKFLKMETENLNDLYFKTYLRFNDEESLFDFINFVSYQTGKKRVFVEIDSSNCELMDSISDKIEEKINQKLISIYWCMKKIHNNLDNLIHLKGTMRCIKPYFGLPAGKYVICTRR